MSIKSTIVDTINAIRSRFAIALAAMFLSACASAPIEQFYTLDTGPAKDATAVSAKDNTGSTINSPPLSLMINRVTVPEAVDRPQMVLQTAPNQVRLDEQHRWAESLRQSIPRIIASDLRQYFQTARIAVAGDNISPTPPILFLTMDILRFESRLGDGVTLEVHWQLRRASGNGNGTATATGTAAGGSVSDVVSRIRESTSGADHDALVAAHRKALATLAKIIADGIVASR